jgi:subtilisin family serine protease
MNVNAIIRSRKTIFLFIVLVIFTLTLVMIASDKNVNQDTRSDHTYARLVQLTQTQGNAKVIVKLNVPKLKLLTSESQRFCTKEPGKDFPWEAINADYELENAINVVTHIVLDNLSGTNYRINRTYKSIPYLALDVDEAGLVILKSIPEVIGIEEDKPTELIMPVMNGNIPKGTAPASGNTDTPQLDNTVGIIGADTAWGMGYTGSGWYVAILDTGIRKTHQFFSGKTVVEACFADGELHTGDCPNGNNTMTGSGAAVHHPSSYQGFDHGTHVSGIAAGNYGSLYGVAKDANIIAVQVFSMFGTASCGGSLCVMSWNSDSLAGLDYIYSIRGSYSISSVNMSLGGGQYSAYCDSDSRKSAIDNLLSVGIATAISTGNNGYCSSIGAPACISTAVSVGSSTDADAESYFNNWHATLQDLFAPGSAIYSSTGDSDTSYESWDGTSMAAPHVTGAWALLKQAKPTGTVSECLTALETTGTSVTSVCDGYTSPIPRIQVDAAINSLAVSTITVSTPVTGSTYGLEKDLDVTWTSDGITGDVKIILRTSDDSSGYTLTGATAYNNSPYIYSIPASVNPGTYFVRVKQGTTVGESGVFYIGEVNVTNPSTGQDYQVEGQIPVQWTTNGIIGNVKITLRKSTDSTGYRIVSSTPYNSSPYNYAIPIHVDPGDYFVRIKQGTAIGESGLFTISHGSTSINVTSPTGSQNYTSGNTIPITWATSGITGLVKITLRRTDNTTGYTIISGIAHDLGSYDYVVSPSVLPGSYFIRIKQNGSVAGVSPSFDIY